MPCSNYRRSKGGFTLSEVLIAVAILAVLAALAVPNLVRFQGRLNMQALDHSAQEIFLAAQNRMTDRKNEGTLHRLTPVSQSGDTYLSEATIDTLLPAGTLEAGLAGHHFYVTYDPASGSVLTVLYSEQAFTYDYGKGAKGKSVEERIEENRWVGYYTGAPAAGEGSVQLPGPNIALLNGEKLIANITVNDLPDGISAGQVQLELSIDGTPIRPKVEKTVLSPKKLSFTVILDSLDIQDNHFSELDSGVAPGSDFTLLARLTSSKEGVLPGPAGQQSGNSLFAAVKNGVAEIAFGRHLQNLNPATSGLGADAAITKAVQTSDIHFEETGLTDDWYTYYTKKQIGYVPVANSWLRDYNGGGRTTTALTVSDAANAGMFATFSGVLTDVYLVNPKISGSARAGGLVGYAPSGLTVNGCQVYHAYTDTSPKEDLAGKGHRIRANLSGGLVGQAAGSLAVKDSFAATTLLGTEAVGGLVGKVGASLTVSKSYADCYLQSGSTAAGAEKSGSAGGLAGAVGGSVSISQSYTVGFVVTAKTAAGFATSPAQSVANFSYSAMVYLDAEKVYSLFNSGAADSAYFLSAAGADNACAAQPQSAAQLMKLTALNPWGFGPATFATTNPYNLMDSMALTVYPFPKLTTLPHYGDWQAEFESGSLVYYEGYEDNTYGFSGAQMNHLKDMPAKTDGYAIVYGDKPEGDATVIYGGSHTVAASGAVPVSVAGEEKPYYLLPLPAEILSAPATADFYQRIITEIDGTKTYYWFNPHFAATAGRSAAEETTPPALRGAVTIRTPRHLNALSQYSDAYAPNGWRFVQEQPLDYNFYDWAALSLARPASQKPIGRNAGASFLGVYDGGGHTITNVSILGEGNHIGLFGYNTGVLRGVVYDSASTVGRTGRISGRGVTVYVGGLVGYNAGTVVDSAVARVRLHLGNSTQSTVYLGGLVGRNAGLIRGSEAACEQVEVACVYASAYVGGLTGGNGGTISQSAAHGAVRASRDTTGTVRAGGFAGGNTGAVGDSYCAVGLYASGGATIDAFCADPTGGSNYYLTNGNYTYRNGAETYSLTYPDGGGAVGLTQLALARQSVPGMTNIPPAPDGTVDDRTQNPHPAPLGVHYGSWLKTLSLGEIGVCYWEKEEKNGESEYHFSYVSAPVGGASISGSLLCTYHDDGGVITEYGYGYYYLDGRSKPALDRSTLLTTSGKDGQWNPSVALNAAAADALKRQTESRYTFVLYNTYDMGSQIGLRPSGAAQNGSWTLKQNGQSYAFTISPFFADAMRYDASASPVPGTENRPYGVRALKQLQFINWDSGNRTYSGAANSDSKGNYAYLSITANNKSPNYHWLQGHDLSARKQNVGYAPIGSFSAWFGGLYDGNDYKIEDLSFTSSFRAVGLFGVTLGGTLKNIVMTSSDGLAKIEGRSDSTAYSGVGGLAGIALKGSANGAITNCSISGYHIVNNAINLGADETVNFWGQTTSLTAGAATGGLVGWCNMDFSGCTAVATVSGGGAVQSYNGDRRGSLGLRVHSDEKYSVMRLGGLVGSAACAIQNCYVGGEVRDDLSGKVKTAYMGGIVGYDSRPVTDHGGAGSPLAVKNCYSFSKITPSKGGSWPVRSVYPLATSGVSNSYYLGERVTGATTNTQGVKLTYAQFSDTESGDGLLRRLGAPFSTVTTVESGVQVDGKYSYPSDSRLDGMNYPFPTVLKQTESNVHYGDWPMKGLVQVEPVELDLVASKDGVPERETVLQLALTPELAATAGAGDTYTVALTEGETPAIATAAVDAQGRLTVTGREEGFTAFTVVYQPKGGAVSYALNVEVVVTAVVRVAVTPAAAVTPVGGSVDFAAVATDRNGNPLDVAWVSVDSNMPAVAEVKTPIGPDGRFAGEGRAEGDAVFTVTAAYTDPLDAAKTYTGTGRAGLSMLPVTVTAQSVTLAPGGRHDYPSSAITAAIQGTPCEGIVITGVQGGSPSVVTAEWRDGVLRLTGVAPGTTAVTVSMTYQYQGSTYPATVPVSVEVLDVGFTPAQFTVLMQENSNRVVRTTLSNPPAGVKYQVEQGGANVLDSVQYDGKDTLTITAKDGVEGVATVRLKAMLGDTELAAAVVTVTVRRPPALTLSIDPREAVLAIEGTLTLPLKPNARAPEIQNITITDVKLDADNLEDYSFTANGLTLTAGDEVGTVETAVTVSYRYDYVLGGEFIPITGESTAQMKITVVEENWEAEFQGSNPQTASVHITLPGGQSTILVSGIRDNNGYKWTEFAGGEFMVNKTNPHEAIQISVGDPATGVYRVEGRKGNQTSPEYVVIITVHRTEGTSVPSLTLSD